VASFDTVRPASESGPYNCKTKRNMAT